MDGIPLHPHPHPSSHLIPSHFPHVSSPLASELACLLACLAGLACRRAGLLTNGFDRRGREMYGHSAVDCGQDPRVQRLEPLDACGSGVVVVVMVVVVVLLLLL